MTDLLNNVTAAEDLLAALPAFITPNPQNAHDPADDNWPDEKTLHPDDANYLKVRGVDPGVAVRRGYKSYYGGPATREYLPEGWDEADAVIRHWKKRFGKDGKPAPDGDQLNRALGLPLFSILCGDFEVLHQLKFLFPRILTEGEGDKAKEKKLKFEVPSGTKRGSDVYELPADVHPFSQERVEDGDAPLILTEGVPKADAMLSQALREGLTVAPVCLTGVNMGYYGAGTKNNPGSSPILVGETLGAMPLNRVVYLCWDADWATNRNVGRSLLTTGRLLTAEGAVVRIVNVPTVAGDAKSGVDDYIAHARAEGVHNPLATLLADAVSLDNAELAFREYSTDDAGRAERLADHMLAYNTHRFNRDAQQWLTWDGKRWTNDTPESVLHLARQLTHRDHDNESNYHAARSRPALNAAVELSKTFPGVSVNEIELDADPYSLNTESGIVDLHDGSLRPHDPNALITAITPCGYDLNATGPTWHTFLDSTFGGDQGLIRWLQRWSGMALRGVVVDEMLLVAFGGGSNGKSTFVEALLNTVGDHYAVELDPDILTGELTDEKKAELKGKRIVVTAETGLGASLNEAAMKKLTSRDRISARRLYGHRFSFTPSHNSLLLTNHRPTITAQDHGTWRRVRFLPFLNTITENGTDKDLPAKLSAEAPAILCWMVEGSIAYGNQGLGNCKAIEDATNAYRSQSDLLGTFLTEKMSVNPTARVSRSEAYRSFQNWCIEQGRRPWQQNAMLEALQERGIIDRENATIKSNGNIYWLGLKFKSDDDDCNVDFS